MPRSARTPFVAALALAAFAVVAAARAASAQVALPDTGLFAPVAARYHARLERLAALAGEPAGPEKLLLMLATGQPDRADSAFHSATEQRRALLVAGGMVMLARHDYAGVGRVLDDLLAMGRGLLPRERALDYAYRFARDDVAGLDSLTRAALASPPDPGTIADLLAAGRVAYARLDYARAESLFAAALAAAPEAPAPAWGDSTSARRALALAGLALVQQHRRDWDGSLVTLGRALAADPTADVLMVLSETLVRLGRTDEAISAAQWAAHLAPYHDADDYLSAHYRLGNGFARRDYTQLLASYAEAFADVRGRRALARADSLLAAGRRDAARTAYAALIEAHPGWADARVRLASLDFEDGRFAEARDGAFAALGACPEYGRAHAVLAKALEGQRFDVDVHRAGYEARFAAAPMPEVPGIERFVTNWRSLSPRHQKRVALSLAPWKAFVPLLADCGATIFIKPMYLLLSECPEMQSLHDQRINYDSRLWDDVRGAGGFHTVTGVEDVERTIFDRYNTVLHEFTHQVHATLTEDDKREIRQAYRRAKERDDRTQEGFLSRYAGGSVDEYFAEGANALFSPMRDAYDPREVVRERLERIDPDLRALVARLMARTDVGASLPVAWVNGGDDAIARGVVAEGLARYRRALARDPANETALLALANGLVLGGRPALACSTAARALAAHPASGRALVSRWTAEWHVRGDARHALERLGAGRALVRAEDRPLVDAAIGRLAWVTGDAAGALAAYDSVLAAQSDDPDGLQGRAAALALAGRTDEAVAEYERAVRMRTGIADLRCAYARDLLAAGRVAAARAQLDAARLLDEKNPTAEALRGWADLAAGDAAGARAHARTAIQWGPWCDLAHVVAGAAEKHAGHAAAAEAEWASVERRAKAPTPPAWVFRPRIATWEHVHELPAVERRLLADFRAGR